MDNVNKLFEDIRKEEVVLFVGAGLSQCAGLPSGGELSKLIFKELAIDLQRELCKIEEELPIIADAFVSSNKNGKDKLINLIQQNFEFRYLAGKRSPLHSIISGIPHFKTIITTNYDELLEAAHIKGCVTIACNEDVARAKHNTTNIIKLHGDFNHRSNIVLTKSDYDSFYCDSALDQPLWTLVKERLATHSILFLGYGLNDGNISSILTEWLGKYLSSSRNPMYFVAPDISKVKSNELAAKGINFIKGSAQEFLPLLKAHLDKNVAHDVGRGFTTMDTAYKYARNNYVDLLFDDNRVVNAKPISTDIRERITFQTSDQGVWHQLHDPDNFDPIRITDFANIAHFVGNLDIPLNVTKEITITPHPTSELFTTIYFPHDDFEVRNIPTKSYFGKTKMSTILSFKGGEIKISASKNGTSKNGKTTGHISCDPYSDDINIMDEIEWLNLMKRMCESHPFHLITDLGTLHDLKYAPVGTNFMEDINFRLEYLLKLIKIERHYGVRFKAVKDISNANIHNVDLIVRNIDGDIAEQTGDIYVRLSIEGCNKFQKEFTFKSERMLSIRRDPEVVHLHGIEIPLGYLIAIVREPQYIDLDKANDEGNIVVNMTAKAGTYRAFFQQESPFTQKGMLKKKYLAM